METKKIYLEREENNRECDSRYHLFLDPQFPESRVRTHQVSPVSGRGYTYAELTRAFAELPTDSCYTLIRDCTDTRGLQHNLDSSKLDGLEAVLRLINKITTARESLR